MTIAPILMRAEELRAGDVVLFRGQRLPIERIRPYDGPRLDYFGLAEFAGMEQTLPLCRLETHHVFAVEVAR